MFLLDPNDIKYVTAKPQYHYGCISIDVIDEIIQDMVIDILEKPQQFLIDNTTKRRYGLICQVVY